jgi:hypothetical protein
MEKQNLFKWLSTNIILLTVRWYLEYNFSFHILCKSQNTFFYQYLQGREGWVRHDRLVGGKCRSPLVPASKELKTKVQEKLNEISELRLKQH